MLNFFNDHRLVYQLGAAPAGQLAQDEGPKKAAKQKDKPTNPEEVDNPIHKQAMDSLDRSLARMNALIERKASPKDKWRHIADAEADITGIKEGVEYAIGSEMESEELMNRLEQAMKRVEKKLEMKLEVDKLISGSPVMKKLYEQIKGGFYGLTQERLLISIDKIFKKEKDPDTALHRAQSEMLKEGVLDGCAETPAKPNELANHMNRLGREQMEQIFKLLDINFDSLNISADQINQLRVVQDISYRFEGATYSEMGLLDSNGNVQKAGLESLLNYENKPADYNPEQAERFRKHLSREAGVSLALQVKAQEKYGKPCKLPTITIGGRPFDLNEIAAENEKEYARFSKIHEGSTPIEKLNEADKRNELPTTVKELLNFRFDEATAADDRVRNELPSAVKTRMEALGMKDPNVSIYRGRIRSIDFKYKDEKISLTVGKNKWGEDYTPHLHIYDNHDKISSRKVDLSNLTEELDAIHKYKIDNQTSIDKINSDYFKVDLPSFRFGGIRADTQLLSAKEVYLGSLVKPSASDRKGPNPKDIKTLEKILPMILANADALGIREDMTLMEAMLKVYQSPKRDELLAEDYSATLASMKKSNSPHYAGVEPEYQYVYNHEDNEKTVKASRESTDPDYLDRKEKMQKMKPGDKMEVKFEGKKYTFVLVNSFANHEYRFKIEGLANEPDFKINNVDLVKRSPEQQFQYMLGSYWRRASMKTEELLQGTIKPEDAPKIISVNRSFTKKERLQYFKNLPLSNVQRQLLEGVNKEGKIKLIMNTDKYGQTSYCEVQWQDSETKTNYRLRSGSGDYWRLSTLEDKTSRTRYPFYDIKTNYVGARLEKLQDKASA